MDFGSKNPSKSCLGGVLGIILAVLAALEGLLERLRLVLGRLEGILDRLGGILGRLGGVLGASRGLLEILTVHGCARLWHGGGTRVARGWRRRGLLLGSFMIFLTL